MLDPEGSVEHQPASSFPKVLLIPLAMLLAIAALMLLAFSATRQKEHDFYTFKVVNIRGKLVSLEKYRGSVSAARRGGSRPGSPCMSAERARGRVLGGSVHTRVPLGCSLCDSALRRTRLANTGFSSIKRLQSNPSVCPRLLLLQRL